MSFRANYLAAPASSDAQSRHLRKRSGVVCCGYATGTKLTGSMKAFMREESISTFVAVPSKLLYRWWPTAGSRSAHCCSLHLVATAAREGCFDHHMCLGLTMNPKRWPTAYRESTHQQRGHLAGGSSSKHSTQHSNCIATLMLLAEASNPQVASSLFYQPAGTAGTW
jgi:hypothetical protein